MGAILRRKLCLAAVQSSPVGSYLSVSPGKWTAFSESPCSIASAGRRGSSGSCAWSPWKRQQCAVRVAPAGPQCWGRQPGSAQAEADWAFFGPLHFLMTIESTFCKPQRKVSLLILSPLTQVKGTEKGAFSGSIAFLAKGKMGKAKNKAQAGSLRPHRICSLCGRLAVPH